MQSVWRYYNPNPLGNRVGDCVPRAVSKALGIEWDKAFCLVASTAFEFANMPSGDVIWGIVLRRNGFEREIIPNTCPDCYTASDFVTDHPIGTYVLGFGGHVATVQDGYLYDSWDSSEQIPIFYYYKPERKE